MRLLVQRLGQVAGLVGEGAVISVGASSALSSTTAVADPLRLALICNLCHTVASRSAQSALR
ncbi:hypothetical protein ABZ313_20970 [Streptomyces sp. NPDC006251]|uniref:hypothetical protein n=1 Tax=Streptomyces sp. NPDC006251 TaxID=3155718 RepID=UPI0033BF02D5